MGSSHIERILGVPTTVITGFLGAGKTSAIQHFLSLKPENERWAVLINEFGEIGVDGSLVKGRASEASGVYVSEVPGGCMCCAAGLPMQISLAQLLRRAKPQRLLVEPTGLGHPLEVLEALSSKHYRDVISLQKTITLVDARKLSDDRYTSHSTFIQQLEIADVVVANKEDLYSEEDRATLAEFTGRYCRADVEVRVTQHGRLPHSCLNGVPATTYPARKAHSGSPDRSLASDIPIPEAGFVTAVNGGEGYESIGWRFSPTRVFDRDRLLAFLKGLEIERMKAVFITRTGIFGYNMTPDALTEVEIDECTESRIEIIANHIDMAWEGDLTNCLEPAA
jgi:G3E family GTPase